MIPYFRAKKIDSDEFVEGYYSPDKNYQEHIHTIFYFDIGDFNVDRKTTTQINPTTLSIHFPDSINTNLEKVWYNLEEISNIIKDYENGRSTQCMSCAGKNKGRKKNASII